MPSDIYQAARASAAYVAASNDRPVTAVQVGCNASIVDAATATDMPWQILVSDRCFPADMLEQPQTALDQLLYTMQHATGVVCSGEGHMLQCLQVMLPSASV